LLLPEGKRCNKPDVVVLLYRHRVLLIFSANCITVVDAVII
jgi:hypothetical protein